VNRKLLIATGLILTLLASIMVFPAVAETTVFADDFEDGDYSGWSSSGTVDMDNYPARGSWSVRLRETGQIWRTISTSGHTGVTFAWYMAAGSLEGDEACYAEVNTGSGWQTVGSVVNGQDNNTFIYGSWTGSAADDNANFQVRFRASTGAAGDYCYADDVTVTSSGSGEDPTATPTDTNTPVATNTPTSTPSGNGIKVAIYTSTGAESDKILALFRAVDAMGFDVYGVGVNDITLGRLTTANFDVLILPAGEGGSKDGYAASDILGSSTAKSNIRSFVNNGGGFLGIEAGAYFATSDLTLYSGTYSPWTSPDPDVYTFSLVDSSFGSGDFQAYMSAGGGYWSYNPASATVVVRNYYNNPVAVRDSYGSGRVILSAMDLELRADSELDWTIWDNWAASGHSNSQQAWSLLGQMIHWAYDGNPSSPTISASNPSGSRVAIVATHTSDGGAWAGLIPAVGRAVEYAGHLPLAIRFDEIQNNYLSSSNFKVVFFPGGYAYGYQLGLDGHESKIRSFVNNGGGYMGVCAGSFYASSSIVWDGTTYDYPLDLFSGQDIGPLSDIAPWPDYDLAPININDSVIGNLGNQQQFYYGGGYKTTPSGTSTVATYQHTGQYSGEPDAIRFTYGDGHVLLVGTHPEARSGSNVDWLYWDNYLNGSSTSLNNPDNPWTFVDAAFDNWLTLP